MENFNVNNLNELATITNGGTLTVAGTTTSPATNVTVNASNATLYVDTTFASTNQPWVNGSNTYTAVGRDSYGRVSTNVANVNLLGTNTFAYDLNGNMLTNNAQTFAYDDENQLIAVWVTNNWMSQFTYDGQNRRRICKEFTWSSAIGNWQLTNEVHYVYDGNLVIQERDINNLPQVTYTRGTDFSGKLEGAGGIGGLLARTANSSTINPELSTFASALYHSDGNGNITALIFTNQTVAAKYEYDPYGNILSQIGSLADANLYRFSSKEYHAASGLVYYLYRYYDSNLQRWLNRDPANEFGFNRTIQKHFSFAFQEEENLFAFLHNQPENRTDPYGLVDVPPLVTGYYVGQVLIGLALGIVDYKITTGVCDNLKPGESAIVQTPLTKLLTVVNVSLIVTTCPNGVGLVYRRVKKDECGNCSVTSVIICESSSGPEA